MPKTTKPPRTAKESVLVLIRKYGANGTILALAEALRSLGSEWLGDQGAATAIEAVTGHSPHRPDDFRLAARCGECNLCQEYLIDPNPAVGCSRRTAQGSFSAGYPGSRSV